MENIISNCAVRANIRRDILMLIAGPISEGLSGLLYDDSTWQNDYESVKKYMELIGETGDFDALCAEYENFAYDLLKYKRPRRAIRDVADALLLENELTEDSLWGVFSMTQKTLSNYMHSARNKINAWTTARGRRCLHQLQP